MKAPHLSVFFGMAVLSAALAADEVPATCHLNAFQLRQPIGLEPQGANFHTVIAAGADEGSYTFPSGARQQANGTIALFATEAGGLRNDLPLGRFTISGASKGADKVRLNLSRKGSTLTVTAVDAANHDKPLTVTRLSKNDSLQAALAVPKANPNLPAVAELDKKTFSKTFGMRSASGTFRPIFQAGVPVKKDLTMSMAPAVPGQTNADFSIYQGDNQYLENDRLYGRYLISGLSPGGKSRFLVHFALNEKGDLETPTVTDSVTKQPLTVRRYSAGAALRLKHAADAESSTPN